GAPAVLQGRGGKGEDEEVAGFQRGAQRVLERRPELEAEEGDAAVRVEVEDDVVVDQDRVILAEIDEVLHGISRARPTLAGGRSRFTKSRRGCDDPPRSV